MKSQDTTVYDEALSNQPLAKAQAMTGKRPAVEWSKVSLGGITGIAFGVAGTRAAEAVVSSTDDEQTEDIQEATANTTEDTTGTTSSTVTVAEQATVGQDLSFSQAFAEARAQVGPGGVFLWHGQLYGTYYADEWEAMNDEQRAEYAASVQPLYGQATHTTATHTTHTTHHQDEPQVEVVSQSEPEVHFLGVESGEIEGQTVNVGMMTVDDVSVALVDVDNDNVFDLQWIDENRNHEIEEGEVSRLEQSITVEDFQNVSQMEEHSMQEGYYDHTSNTQEDLAPDMPDYMNDADTGII